MPKIAAVVLAVVVSCLPVLAAAPRDAVFFEFLAGTVGGYAGAAVGAIALSWAFSTGATGWDALARTILGAFLGFAGGTIVGSSLGVIAGGSLMGVDGNMGLTFLGAAAGTGVMFGIGIGLQIPEAILPLAPPVAAAAATAGFNVGARARK